jgi:hypothetical protein
LVAVSVWLSLLPPAKAAATDSVSKAQVRAAVKQAVEIAYPDANVDQLKFSDRDDLDEELSQISGTTARNVSFYDVDWPSGDTAMWAVDTDGSPQSSSALYSFESTDRVDQSLKTFNRLLSHQAPIPDDKVESVARFFLTCCVRDTPGEIVNSEDAMHHAIERYYLEVYGDVWRSLEAYTQWWHDYEQSPAQFTPAVVAEVVGRQVSLKRLVLSPGMHPQLQQWDIEVSPDGDVRVVSILTHALQSAQRRRLWNRRLPRGGRGGRGLGPHGGFQRGRPARLGRQGKPRAHQGGAQELRLRFSLPAKRHRQPRTRRHPQGRLGHSICPWRWASWAARAPSSARRFPTRVFLGELSLDGSVRPVRGALSAALAARASREFARWWCPEANAREAAVVEGVEVYAHEIAAASRGPDQCAGVVPYPVTVDAQMLAEAAQYSGGPARRARAAGHPSAPGGCLRG